MSESARIVVVGIGADGWAGLPVRTQQRIGAAPVVVGAKRQLGLLPDVEGQERRAWGSPFDLAVLDDYAGRDVLVLASGDPTVSGVGSTLVARHGRERVEIVPAVSSVSLARARMGWPDELTTVVSLTSRHVDVVRRHLAPFARILVLAADERTPAALAAVLVDAGHGDAVLTVLGDLGAPEESRRSSPASTWSGASPRLAVCAVECRAESAPGNAWVAGLPDDAYEHDGQLTKRDLRASALARLAPQPGQLLWDVGAGAGSVGIEWMRAHPGCLTWAIEADDVRAARIRRNAARLGVPDLHVSRTRAPAGLDRAPAPHAVFVGGGATEPGLLDLCRSRLVDGGRLVVHGVTLETEQVLVAAYAEHGGELTRHAVETARPLGSFTGWEPARTVVQWAWTKRGPSTGGAEPDWMAT